MGDIIKNKLPNRWLLVFSFLFVGNIAIAQTAPGGVTSGLSLWLKADAGTSTTTAGANITTWTDQSLAGNSINNTVSGVTGPTYQTTTAKLKNFNPTVNFSGSQYLARATNVLQAQNGYSAFLAGGTTARYMFCQPDNAGGWTDASPELGTNVSYNSYALNNFYTQNATTSSNGNKVASYMYDSSSKTGIKYNEGVGGSPANPYSMTNTLTTSAASSGMGFTLGARPLLGYSNGDLSEVIAYTVPLSGTNLTKVESYLAIKYGVSLNNGTGYQYLNSAGTTIWNNTTNSGYNNSVAGIARDNNSTLNQKQSQSSYGSGSQVVMALGTVATTNQLNTNTITADQQSFIWGDDVGSITVTTTISGLGTLTKRLTRVWKTQNTGVFGQQIMVYYPVSSLTTFGTTPYLLYATTATLLNTGATAIANNGTVSVNGVNYYSFIVPGSRLANMNFFSFGITSTPISLARTHVLVNPSTINSSQQNGRLK